VPNDSPVGRQEGKQSSELSSELERSVEGTYALVAELIGRLLRRYPEQAIGGVALEDLQQMRPHLQGALATLSQIEERRKLTEKELSYRRAFKMLYEASR
jgi:hypothetical protein